jgi:hypothetical protein
MVTLPISTGMSPAMITLRCTVASRARTTLATIRQLKPWPYINSSSVTPCGLPASSSSTRRCSGPRRRFRGDEDIRNHDPSLHPLRLVITLLERRPATPPEKVPTQQPRHPSSNVEGSPHAFRRPCTGHVGAVSRSIAAPGTLVLRRSRASPSRSARSASQTASRRRSETGIPFADPASAPRTRA